MYAKDTYSKNAGSHDRLVIDVVLKLTLMLDAVFIPTFVEAKENIDLFIIYMFDNNTFWEQAAAHDRLAIDAVIIQFFGKKKCNGLYVFQTNVFAKDTFKACSRTW